LRDKNWLDLKENFYISPKHEEIDNNPIILKSNIPITIPLSINHKELITLSPQLFESTKA